MQAPLKPREVFGMPWIDPMLAMTAPAPFDDPDFLFEVKWDGYRCIAYLTAREAQLFSRNGKPLLPRFPKLSGIWKKLRQTKANRVVLDGEIVAMRQEKVDFSRLSTNPEEAVYVVFDLLHLDEKPLSREPLSERRGILSQVLEWGENLHFSYGIQGKGHAMFSWVKERNLEGIMAKRLTGLYYPGKRSGEWLKIRNILEGRFWVIGYLPSPGRELGSLIVAQEEEEGGLTMVGRVSSGLSAKTEKELLGVLGSPLNKPYVAIRGTLSKNELKSAKWVRPFFGVLVHYTEITPEGRLRHPVFREVIRCPGAATKRF